MNLNKLLLICGILFESIFCSLGFLVSIDAHAEECFYEKVTKGTKISLTFEVVDGGFLDIDVKITAADGTNIYTGDRESSGKFTFAAMMDGRYKACFINQISTVAPKVVMFNIDVGLAPRGTSEPVKDEDADQTKLEDMIRELSAALATVKHEQEYMHVRDKMHRAINESTNSRVVLWSTFEALVLVIMTLGQVYYLKRFFEVKRVV